MVIRAFVRWPAPLEVSGPVEPGEAAPACADLVVALHHSVRVGAPDRRRKLFDGYFTPPKYITRQEGQR